MIRFLVVSDCELLRLLLSDALAAESGFLVASETAARLVLVDAAMTGAAEVVAAAAERGALPVVVNMGRHEIELVSLAAAGAVGFVMRDAGVADLMATARGVWAGGCPCDPWVSAALLRSLSHRAKGREPLTAREEEIAERLKSGLSNKEIARALNIGVATAKNHVHNVLRKLDVPSRAKAIAQLRSEHPR